MDSLFWRKMNGRVVTTLSLFILAIAVIVSGVALYVGPQAR